MPTVFSQSYTAPITTAGTPRRTNFPLVTIPTPFSGNNFVAMPCWAGCDWPRIRPGQFDGMVTRVVQDKGFEILVPLLDRLLSDEVRLIGSSAKAIPHMRWRWPSPLASFPRNLPIKRAMMKSPRM